MASNQIVMNFHSDAVKDDTLLVATAEGVEALAQPFRFDLDLVSADPGLDLAAILRVNARLSLNRTMDLGDGRSGDIAYDYHGILTEFRQLGRAGKSRYRYRAVLRPHLWKLACTRRSRIFTDKNVPDLLRAVLDEAGIAFKCKFADEKIYPINPYVVQYEETDLDFISRWMEHVGISYYYDAEGDLGTLIVIDNVHGYAPINPYDERVVFDDQASTGVWSSGRHQRIRSLEVEEARLPKRVQLKEYNYEAPTNELKYETEVDAEGLGTWYEYNSNYRTESEAKFLLGVRKEFWLGRRRRLNGQADHRSFQPGRTFTLKEHFNPNISDSNYALIDVRHHLSQADGDDVGTTGEYTCDFIAMPADLPHRPERVTAWPSIHGVVNARIAGGAFGYAELDDMGRYKVDVDYDLNDQTIGKVRMAQPSVGENAGMHFPLRKHTEVLLGHIDGDPDKPVILGAVHDGEKTNLLDKATDPLGTNSSLKSQSGNVMHMNDGGNQPHMILANGSFTSVQRLGNPDYAAAPGAASSAAHFAGKLGQGVRPKAEAKKAGSNPVNSQIKSTPSTTPTVKLVGGESSSAHFPSGDSAGDTSVPAASTTPLSAFWTSISNKWQDTGKGWVAAVPAVPAIPAAPGRPAVAAVPAVDAVNGVADWKAQAIKEFTSMYRTAPGPVEGTDFESTKSTAVPTEFKGYSKMNAGSADAPDDCSGEMAKVLAPGLGPVGTTDPDSLFANFVATAGGTQTFSVGDDMKITHGNLYQYRRGHTYNYQIGDNYNFGLCGNSYNFNWNDLSVTWTRGTNQEISYMEESNAWSYNSGNANAYETIKGDKVDKTKANTVDEYTNVTHYHRSRLEAGSIEEFTACGGSTSMSIGGPSLDISMNLGRVEVEGAVSLKVELSAAVEIAMSIKAEIKMGTSYEFDAVKKEDLKVAATYTTALATKNTALEAEKAALLLVDAAADVSKIDARIAKITTLISNTQTKIVAGGIGLFNHSVACIFA